MIPASARLPALLLSLLLGACAGTAPPATAPLPADRPPSLDEAASTGAAARSLGDLLARAETLPSPESQRAYLEAAELLVELNRQEDALGLLGAVSTRNLPPELTLDILLFQARLLVEGNRGQRALGLLNNQLPVELGRLPAASQREVRDLRAQAYETSQQFLPAAQELINASNLLRRDELPAHHERIWNLLGALRAEELQDLAGSALTATFQGWYELAYIGKAYQYNLDRQLTELERWRQTWPRHPASSPLPAPLQMIQTLAAERPNSLALLLPLATPAGQIIRDGFLTAYFEALSLGGQVPRLRLYDTTSTQDVRALVDQARADGAELIVGPLQKALVDQLLDLGDLELPVLALNAVEGEQSRSGQVYQFALSPENEARQIAERAWRDGHRRVAILSPRQVPGEDLFNRKRDSFVARWQQLGGRVVQQESYGEDYTAVIERLLDLDESEARRAQLRQVLGRPLEFTQRRRQDIDFILLIASPATARQIKPSLAYLYAGDIPVYASQDIFSGLERPQQDRDLDGILFGDSPWLLGASDELKSAAQQLFPQDNALNLRLQAFGIDAFRLYSRLRQLESVPDSQLYGATGVLRLGPGQVIEQELYWARFDAGRAAAVDPAN